MYRRSPSRSQRVSAKGTWNMTRGVTREVTVGGPGASTCARRFSAQPLYRGRAGTRRPSPPGSFSSLRLGFLGAPPRPPHREPSSFSQLFRRSRWAPRPPAGDVTMVQRDGQWAAAGPGIAGQWRRRTVPRSCPARAALRRPPAAGVCTAAQRSGRGGSECGCGGRRRLPPARQSRDLRLRAHPQRDSALSGSQRGRGPQARDPVAPHDEEVEAQRRKVIYPRLQN